MKGRKEKGREGKGERKGRKEKGREGKGKRERKKKKEGKEEKRRGKQSGYKNMWARRPAFFFLLNNYQVIPFQGKSPFRAEKPLQGWWCHKTPFRWIGTGDWSERVSPSFKGCRPFLMNISIGVD